MTARGFTLVELMISISLSMIVMAALVPVNIFSLRSIAQVQGIEKQINLLGQSLKLIENDLKSAALTGCALDKRLIDNSLFADTQDINWISGYSNNGWFPNAPNFANLHNIRSFDAVLLVRVDMSNPVSIASLETTPGRIVFITNCLVSEISRASESRLLNLASASPGLSVFALQYIQYYVKENQGKQTLYRQYLTKSGKPRNEPLVDNIGLLKIGYAEKTADGELAINTAAKVSNWKNIAAVYISITLQSALNKPVSSLVMLENHVL